VRYDEDIEPDQLLPLYLESKTKLFEIQRPRQDTAPVKGKGPRPKRDAAPTDPDEALLLAKIEKVEKDILFDKFVGEQQWKEKKIGLEKDYSIAKKNKADEEKAIAQPEDEPAPAAESDDVNDEAARIAAEILAEGMEDDDDDGIADLFASLPVHEVDPVTGKGSTVMNGADGSKVTIRDFGKWTGVSPMRALEEACRSRYVCPGYPGLSKLTFVSGTRGSRYHIILSPTWPLRPGTPSTFCGPSPRSFPPPSRPRT